MTATRGRRGSRWGPGAGLAEEDSDWVAHEDEFDSSIFAAEETALRSLDESNATAADRRPWEFDLPSVGGDDDQAAGAAGVHEDGAITEQVRAVEPRATTRTSGERTTGQRDDLPTGSTAARAGSGADDWVPEPDPAAGTEGDDEDWVIVEPERPGRARRGQGRVRPRARRPEGADDPDMVPLAAEPPGASVTDVPGVGLKRGSGRPGGGRPFGGTGRGSGGGHRGQ